MRKTPFWGIFLRRFSQRGPRQKGKSMENTGETAKQLTSKQAGRMIGRGIAAVRRLVREGKLPRYGTHPHYWHRIEDVEAVAREPRRVLRREDWERKSATRLLPPDEIPPDRVMIDSLAAQKILGVCAKTISVLVNNGQLLSYQKVARSTPHRFDLAEVEALRDRRAAAKKAPRPPREPSRRPHYITRERLQCGKRIVVGDLPPQDKYFPEWINARQVAWLLNTTMNQAYWHRDAGHIRAVKDPAVAPRNCQWLFCKADVDKLMNDPQHCKGRYHYAKYCTPEAIAENKAKRQREAEAQFREQLDACE